MPINDQGSNFFARGGVWVLAQSVLMLLVVVVPPLSPVSGSRPFSRVVIAAALLVIGAVYGVAGVIALGPNRTSFPVPKHQTRLVTSGIYRFVRHPLYASVGFLSAGWVIFWWSPLGLILLTQLIVVLVAKAKREEFLLSQRFPEYKLYKERTKCLIPWLI